METNSEIATTNRAVAKLQPSTLVLQQADAEHLWGAVGQLIETDFAKLSPDEVVDLADLVPSLLPPDVQRRIFEFRRRAPEGDVLLLRGLIPKGLKIPPSVSTSSALPPGQIPQRAALLLVGITGMFGEPFNYTSLWGGRLVQNMVPVRGKEYNQTSQSSSGTLDWHVEDGFREDRCDYVGLICLRGDPIAASMYAQAQDLQLAPELEETLREKRFQLRPDTAHVIEGVIPQRQIAVLTGPKAKPEICYDTHHITPIDPADTAAAMALRVLHSNLDRARVSHVMEMGDLLIFDNRRVVHARGPFAARYDGTDRWLMRTMICGSFVRYRRWGRRIPD